MTLQSEVTTIDEQSIEKVVSGQKLILYAILLNFITIGLQVAVVNIAGLVAIIAIIMLLVGMFRLSSGLGYSDKDPPIHIEINGAANDNDKQKILSNFLK